MVVAGASADPGELLEGLTEPEANPEGARTVDEIRSAIVDVFAEFGVASNQIGKTYPMLASLNRDAGRPECTEAERTRMNW